MIRAKFRVDEVIPGGPEKGPQNAETVLMRPVTPDKDPMGENQKFWNATPSGEIKMTITNPEAWGSFRPGMECYVDFTPAEQEEYATQSG
jgi:hypothetical protein